MRFVFSKLVKDENGVTAIEYGLIAALVAVACITIWTTLGNDLVSTFTSVSNCL
ncbi:MAG: Flp family type IVb pilin [Stellaceae bacterium]